MKCLDAHVWGNWGEKTWEVDESLMKKRGICVVYVNSGIYESEPAYVWSLINQSINQPIEKKRERARATKRTSTPFFGF